MTSSLTEAACATDRIRMAAQQLNKTSSEPNLSIAEDDGQERNYITSRAKRKRPEVERNSIDFSEFRQEMTELFEIFTHRQDLQMQKQDAQLQKLFPILKGIQDANNNIETTISFLAEQNAELRGKIGLLEEEIKSKNEYITVIEDRLEDSIRTSRKSSIEIKNVPVETKETKEGLVNMVENLSRALKLNITKSDIRDIYKSKSPTDKKSIIVELSSTLLKEDILKSAKAFNKRNHVDKLCAKHLGNKKNPDSPIFVSEHLTPKAARLFFLARDLRKSKGYKYCWTTFGRVYVRKEDNSPIVHITSEAQIQTMLNK